MSPRRPPRRGPWRWWGVTAALALVGFGCLWVGLRGHPVSLGLPATPHRSAPPSRSVTAPVVPRSTPVALSIPAIGVSTFLSQLGLNPDSTVQVPTDSQEPGWYHLGPAPGQVGSAVILGHVDSHTGPAVFFNLRSLAAGDKVEVALANGLVVDFAVTSVAMYPNDQFPAQQVYGSHGYSGLELVTCGGTFDSNTGHYLSNVVVYTSLVSTNPPVVPAPRNASIDGHSLTLQFP